MKLVIYTSTDSPILNFQQWQAVLEEVNHGKPESAEVLLKDEFLVKRDSEEGLSSMPGYKEVIDWWIRGGPDMTVGEAIRTFKGLKEARRNKADQSAKYWAGIGSNLTNEQKYQNFVKVIDALLAKKNSPELQGLKFSIDDLAKVKDKLEELKRQGYLLKNYTDLGLFLPFTLVDNYVPIGNNQAVDVSLTITNGKPGSVEYDKIINYLKNFQPKSSALDTIQKLVSEIPNGQRWVTSVGLTSRERSDLLKGIYFAASRAYESKKKSDPNTKIKTPEDAIRTASSLYIIPYGQPVELTQTEYLEHKNFELIQGSYPANPIDPTEIEKGKSFFQDNSITVSQDCVNSLRSAVKEAMDHIEKVKGVPIEAVVYAIASTSKVPTSYRSKTNSSTIDNNFALAEDRIKSILSVLTTALKETTKIPTIRIDEDKNQNLANSGPDWTGKKDDSYEQVYGSHRFAAGVFEIYYLTDYQKETPESSTKPQVIGKWKYFVSWQKPSLKLKIPSLRIPLPKLKQGSINSPCNPW